MKRRHKIILFTCALLAVSFGGLALWLHQPSQAPGETPAAASTHDATLTALEDLVEALEGVSDATSADLIAARIAVDYLVLHDCAPTENALATELENRVQALSEAVQQAEFHGSPGLRAAMSLARMRPGHAEPLPRSAAAAAGLALMVNSRDVIIMLLDSVNNLSSAEAVVPHLESVLAYAQVLQDFAGQFAESELEAAEGEELYRQLEDSRRDLQESVGTVLDEDCFGSAALKTLLEEM